MIRKIFTICGREYVAVRVAKCSGRDYINFSTPNNSQTK